MQVIIFNLDKERYAINTQNVESINDKINITKVPKSPKYIKGLINLRGNIITMLNIHLLLGLKEIKEQNNIVILKTEEEFLGMTVDSIDEVLNIDESEIKPVDEKHKKDYIKGIIKLNGNLITLLDIENVMPKD